MNFPPLHQAHDPTALLRRWRAVAKKADLNFQVLLHVEDEPIYLLESTTPTSQKAIYLSTGVHGDEAAPPWALLLWAEAHLDRLRSEPWLIFPCLNPIGLRANTRLDSRGLDLNRRFHLTSDPLARAWQKAVHAERLSLALCLHEDYDAEGCYLYQLVKTNQKRPKAAQSPPETYARAALQSAANHLPIDSRKKIDGMPAKTGLIWPKKIPADLKGMPEAVELWRRGCPLTLTFETPSEFAFEQRVRAHLSFIEATTSRSALP